MSSCFIVTFAGGQCAGKKAVMAAVKKRLEVVSNEKLRIACLHLADFTKTAETEPDVDKECIDAYDLEKLADVMETYKTGIAAEGPVDVLLVEGSYLLCTERLLGLANIKVFVDLNADARLGRRVLRDTENRHLPLDHIFDQYVRFGKHAFDERINPTKSLADIILPQGPEVAAIDLIAMALCDDIYGEKDSNSARGKQQSSSASIVASNRSNKMYSPAPPITLGEVDIENFYDPI